MNIGENIKKLRKQKGWSQSQLAGKIDVHLTNVNRLEKGYYTPSLETVINLCKALEVPFDYLIYGETNHLQDVEIEDRFLADRLKLINTLDEDERQIIIKIIDALIAKKQIVSLASKIVQHDLVAEKI